MHLPSRPPRVQSFEIYFFPGTESINCASVQPPPESPKDETPDETILRLHQIDPEQFLQRLYTDFFRRYRRR